MLLINRTIIISILSLSVFTGCGDTVNKQTYAEKVHPTYPTATGRFIDSGVSGLEYKISSSSKFTKDDGSFSYIYGNTILFKVGNLEIGKALGTSTVTPKDIVTYKNLDIHTSLDSPEVNNRVRLLMSLDSDNAPANGISISQDIRNKAQTWTTPDYNLNEVDFTTEFYKATNNDIATLVSKDAAAKHFASSLRCVYSGAYSGQWQNADGEKEGFVGVMIQSSNTVDTNSPLGTIVALGDGQDLNGDGKFEEYLFARGEHDMNTGFYNFNQTGIFQSGGIIPSDIPVDGNGSSLNYDQVSGSFIGAKDGGVYQARRVGEGKYTAYRYTGFGYGSATGIPNKQDPILGLFTLDFSVDGKVTGLIHDASDNNISTNEPALTGTIDYKNNGETVLHFVSEFGKFENNTLSGNLDTTGTDIHLVWKDDENVTLGYISGVGCQLQPHN